MNREVKSALIGFLIELVIYGALVVAYFFLVLAFLDTWLRQMYDHDRRVYAAVALGLIIGQGILLEVLTRGLLALVKPRRKD